MVDDIPIYRWWDYLMDIKPLYRKHQYVIYNDGGVRNLGKVLDFRLSALDYYYEVYLLLPEGGAVVNVNEAMIRDASPVEIANMRCEYE
jgi:hypothetical protein